MPVSRRADFSHKQSAGKTCSSRRAVDTKLQQYSISGTNMQYQGSSSSALQGKAGNKLSHVKHVAGGSPCHMAGSGLQSSELGPVHEGSHR